MTPARVALLSDRGVVRVAGEDAEKLLQGIITSDMGLLARQPAIHTALLTPQGKILFEFFVAKAPGGYLLEAAKDKTAELAKRLAMYKLRAKVEIADVSDQWDAWAAWGADSLEEPWMLEAQSPEEDLQVTDLGFLDSVSFRDPRLWELGSRWIVPTRLRPQLARMVSSHSLGASDDYHAHRITLGVPEGGKDYAFGDAFPHEADMDDLHGVSFDKGCFVGQEVVSRMQHRAHVRKRVVPVDGEAPLTSGADIMVGAAAVIGRIGSAAGTHALGFLRLDRAAEATAKGEVLTAGGVPVRMRKPEWAQFELAPALPADAP